MQRTAFDEMLKTQNLHWWFRGKRAILGKIIEEKVFSGSPLEILEVGCGTGSNLPMLARFGNVAALELDDYARGSIAPERNVFVAKGYLPEGMEAVRGRVFDLICLFDVLEHIEQDEKALGVLSGYMSSESKLLLTVPAYQWMFGIHDRVLGHHRRYTRSRIGALCSRQGYEILYSSYMNSLLFPLMAGLRLIERLRSGSGHSAGTGIPPFGFNALLYKIFSMEALWIPKHSMLFGGSVIVLCQRRMP